ncbi:MAG TPA: 4Fe-4S binding protein [Chromatiales bacterium]|nr:4Fe-4S binding protein [Thiotrichales bacterium]HIP67796.1 4Fe-4S binding protein [Chromatiales bacterium]
MVHFRNAIQLLAWTWVIINADGKIKALHHVSSRETTSYLERIQKSGFYQQFAGLSLSESEQKIDAVSGATLSTVAIARSVTALVDKASDSPLGIYLDEDTHDFSIDAVLSKAWIIHAFALSLFFIFAWQRRVKRSRKLILITAVLSVGYIGFYLNNSFTYVTFMHPFLGVSLSGLVTAYAALVLWSSVWNQNGYCRYVCPYGNFQRLLTRFIPQWRQQPFIPAKYFRKIRLILTLILAGGIILGLRHWSSFELYPDLFGLDVFSAWFWVSFALVLTSMVYPMLWCRLLCPTGAVLDLLTKWTSPKRASKSAGAIESVINFVPKKSVEIQPCEK